MVKVREAEKVKDIAEKKMLIQEWEREIEE